MSPTGITRPDSDEIHALEELLATSFARDELERFAGRVDPLLPALLPGQIASRAQLTHAFVGALLDRGLLTSTFFELLTKERPHKFIHIAAVKRQILWIIKNPVPDAPTGAFAGKQPDRATNDSIKSVWIPVILLTFAIAIMMWGIFVYDEFKQPPYDRRAKPSDNYSFFRFLSDRGAADATRTIDPYDTTLGTSDGWIEMIKNEKTWAHSVMKALNSVKISSYRVQGASLNFKFGLIVCPDGKVLQILQKQSTGDAALDDNLNKSLSEARLPAPPPLTAGLFMNVCKRLPYEFTLRMSFKGAKIE